MAWFQVTFDGFSQVIEAENADDARAIFNDRHNSRMTSPKPKDPGWAIEETVDPKTLAKPETKPETAAPAEAVAVEEPTAEAVPEDHPKVEDKPEDKPVETPPEPPAPETVHRPTHRRSK